MRSFLIWIVALALCTSALASDAASYAVRGKAKLMDGRCKNGIIDLERAVAADPGNSEYHDWLGRAYGCVAETASVLSAFGQARKALHEFERAVELNPSNLEALSDAFEYYLEAPGIAGGGLDKAEIAAKRFAARNQAEYHWALARIAEKRKDFATAEREYRGALALEPQEIGRTLDLATFLSSRGRFTQSDALFQTAVHEHPSMPKVLYARAAADLRGKRNLDEAEALLERCARLPGGADDPPMQDIDKLLHSARSMRATMRQAE